MKMDRIRAPYGFVPLANNVAWADANVSHDHPFEDGLCGTFDLIVEAETPLFVRGAADPAQFFATPDGRCAIPGSSLRGALRNVLEIATFAKMGRVNNHRFAVRDLHNPDVYGRHMAEVMELPSGKKQPMPKVEAGWLVRGPGAGAQQAPVATIQPCHFAKIEYGLLTTMAKRLGNPRYTPGRKQSAPDKYRAWGKNRAVTAAIQVLRPRSKVYTTDFGEVTSTDGRIQGTLVLTGQPSTWSPTARSDRSDSGHPKHHDFVFYDAPGIGPVPVSAKQMEDFEFIHRAGGEVQEATGEDRAKRGQQGALRWSEAPNPEWRFWREHFVGAEARYFEDRRVPVFFLRNVDGSLRAFGLAMMFRLAYDHTTWDAVENAQPDAGSANLDLVEALFGTVRRGEGDDEQSAALKGRISFGLSRVQGSPRVLPPVCAVLAAPKASYYPCYVEQRKDPHGAQPERVNGKPKYRTYMDPDVRVRGWKRYRPLTEAVEKPLLPLKGTGQVSTTFAPLDRGTMFRGRVRVHNVRPAELGAVLWALDFGGDSAARHQLGLARPLGFGRVRLGHAAWEVEDMRGGKADPRACVEAFHRSMDARVSGWAESVQIRELIALARPIARAEGRYMHIGPQNEFQDAKKAGLALGRASGQAEVAPPPVQKAWVPLRRGTRVRVLLVERNPKGKWRADLVETAGRGVIEGAPPADAATGQAHEVVVVAGGDPKNLNLKWP